MTANGVNEIMSSCPLKRGKIATIAMVAIVLFLSFVVAGCSGNKAYVQNAVTVSSELPQQSIDRPPYKVLLWLGSKFTVYVNQLLKIKAMSGPAKYRNYKLYYSDDTLRQKPFYVGISCQAPYARFSQHIRNKTGGGKKFILVVDQKLRTLTEAKLVEQRDINVLRAVYNLTPDYLRNKVNSICPNNPLALCVEAPYPDLPGRKCAG
ncbi:MAG: hypothetical protein AAES65_22120 [Candidatus Thiodiazotropha sp. (ex. Lucinoma kazani)]